jgi:hypothetical protein
MLEISPRGAAARLPIGSPDGWTLAFSWSKEDFKRAACRFCEATASYEARFGLAGGALILRAFRGI